MRIYVRTLSTIIFGIFILGDINAKPWNNNTREHLFGDIDTGKNSHVSIQDEGFRWRNSFNFKINGQPISSQNWLFNKIISYNSETNSLEKAVEFSRGADADSIHSHLAKIAGEVQELNRCASTTAAAITIVVDNGRDYYAFSETMSFNSKPWVATTSGEKSSSVVQSVSDTADLIKKNINNIIDCNIPESKYSCSEGKILSKLTCKSCAILKSTITHLLRQAQKECQNQNLNYNSVRLVVLHIGTTMDPCAICTRCLVGVSKHINKNINKYLCSTSPGRPAESMNNTKFLIEVSSNGHYATVAQHNNDNKQDNFAAFGYGTCSHTECAGHDGQEANPINVQLNQKDTEKYKLFTPHGSNPRQKNCNWSLSNTFPPYVIFGRMYKTYNVGNAPAQCNIVNHKHNAINDLPLVK